MHEIKWDKEKIQNFWNNLSANGVCSDLYFSRQKGHSVLKLVGKYIEVSGRVVDLGCGPGYLIEHLLAAGIPCQGADLSPESVRRLNERLAGNPLFRGATSCDLPTEVPFAPDSVDVMFFLETLEHLLSEDRDECLRNIHSALAEGGHLVITVPFREDLERSKVVCPRCGCRFHRVQHVHAYDARSLVALLERHDISAVFCRPVILLPEWRIYLRSLFYGAKDQPLICPECSHAFRIKGGFWRNLAGKFLINKIYHLVFIGRKRPS